ncbi:perlucin-like protein [Asterias amurensis]|uniref:perlucin-like protein n=1 Tax=Asterias amurensis TaxID=7602 RepID=UPI003AB448E2
MFTTLFVTVVLIVKYITISDGQCFEFIGGECPQGWGAWKGKCYIVTEPLTWGDSKEKCNQMGGAMVVPQSQEDIEYFSSLHYVYWAGCTDLQTEGSWECLGSEEYAGKWHSREPNGKQTENCMEVYSNRLNDKPCNSQVRAICERESVPKLHL